MSPTAVEHVRQTLPDVPVLLDGRKMLACLSGRLDSHATLALPLHPFLWYAGWDTVAQAVVTGEPLVLS